MKSSYHEIVYFGISGIIGFFADYLVLKLLLSFAVSFYIARLFSFLCALTITWIINRNLTFHHKYNSTSISSLFKQWLIYFFAMLGGGIFNYLFSTYLHNQFSTVKEYPILSVIGGTAVGMFFNFFTSKYVVFGKFFNNLSK